MCGLHEAGRGPRMRRVAVPARRRALGGLARRKPVCPRVAAAVVEFTLATWLLAQPR